ncbi:MAG: 30S ribosomal protein S1 [Bacteroidales bacterium]|jgi:small subunit ribosomal protein S1
MTDELNVNQEAENSEEITNQLEEQVIDAAKEEEVAIAENAAQAEAEEVVPEVEAVKEEVAVVEEPIAQTPTKPRYVKEVISLEDFDWDAIGKKQLNYSSDERKKLEDVYDKTFSQIVEQEVVDGIVVAKNNREVVVNIGFKSDGVIPLSETRYNPNLKIGDTIEVYVESQEDVNGQLILSHKKARLLKSWDRVNKAFETQEIITGYVKCRTKGGLIVDVFGIEAFLPGSQIDVKPIRDYDIFVEKNMEFKVVKINHEYKNVVVSHKALIEDEIEQQKADIIAKLEKGQVLEGTVKNITSYGVFIDLGGVDGLVHITDLSWGRINHPEEIVTLDEKINVVILDFDENKKRIALGLKQLTPHPWDALDANLAVGDKIKGKVVVIADYGAFMEIVPGVEGLIHVSEMSWSQHLRTAHDFLKIGNEVEAVILTLDREERKMSLGIKQLIPDPWTNIADKYPLKSKHNAVVRNFTNFGIFVELEEGVDGLIHISDLSWSKKIKHPAEFTKIGDSIEVIVLEVDSENRRLSLGHKQLEENPWEIFETVFTVDSIHKGTIVSSSDKGAIIALPYGVEGFAPLRHLVKEDGSNAKTDEAIDFKVLEFSKDSKKIIVSHSKIFQDVANDEKSKADNDNKRKERDQKKSVKQNNDNLERSTLGDIEALSNLKSEMQKSEMEKLEAMTKRVEDKKTKKVTEDVVEEQEVAPETEVTPDIESTIE